MDLKDNQQTQPHYSRVKQSFLFLCVHFPSWDNYSGIPYIFQMLFFLPQGEQKKENNIQLLLAFKRYQALCWCFHICYLI